MASLDKIKSFYIKSFFECFPESEHQEILETLLILGIQSSGAVPHSWNKYMENKLSNPNVKPQRKKIETTLKSTEKVTQTVHINEEANIRSRKEKIDSNSYGYYFIPLEKPKSKEKKQMFLPKQEEDSYQKRKDFHEKKREEDFHQKGIELPRKHVEIMEQVPHELNIQQRHETREAPSFRVKNNASPILRIVKKRNHERILHPEMFDLRVDGYGVAKIAHDFVNSKFLECLDV